MKKGNIYKLKPSYKNKYDPRFYNHPFIFWEDNDSGYKGIMLTTSEKGKYENILLDKSHFDLDSGFTFGKPPMKPNSLIAPLFLQKEVKEEHLNCLGKLSEKGIDFIKDIIPKLEETDWGTYKKYNNSYINTD